VVFRRSTAPADTLTDFYLGETLYQLALYDQAREVFAGAAARRPGAPPPQGARRPPAGVRRLFPGAPGAPPPAAPPPPRTPSPDEARRVEARGRPHRHQEIALGLGRAYLAVGDVARARAVLLSIAAEEGPQAAEARELLTRPAP